MRNAGPKSPRPVRRPPHPRLVSDPAPASLKMPQKKVRPLPQLPAGPFPVPVSTLDWLLSLEAPAARYVTLRDLMARPEKDIELKRAQRALSSDPFVRDALFLLRQNLLGGFSREQLERKYEGILWQSLFLAETGAGRSLPELQKIPDILLSFWQKAFVDMERLEEPGIDAEMFSVSLRILALLGLGADSRVVTGAEYLAKKRLAAEGDLSEDAAPAVRELLLFVAIPAPSRTALVHRALDFCIERAAARALPRVETAETADFIYPALDRLDLLEILDVFARCGVPKRREFDLALKLVLSRGDHRARWKGDPAPAGPVFVIRDSRAPDGERPLELERSGEPSRWVTMRALRVMQHFFGLTLKS